jgi:hypothetical protein
LHLTADQRQAECRLIAKEIQAAAEADKHGMFAHVGA